MKTVDMLKERCDKAVKFAADTAKENAQLDQQNKELRDRIEKLEVDNQDFNSDDIYKSHEIQRLTKELNDLGVKFDKSLERWQERDVKQSTELTRLRELLVKTKPYLSAHREYQYASQERKVLIDHLLTEIDNALNHKS